MGWTTQGARVTIPGDVQETTRHGTQCYGLGDKEVIAETLDVRILKFFSERNDSVTLWLWRSSSSNAPVMSRDIFH